MACTSTVSQNQTSQPESYSKSREVNSGHPKDYTILLQSGIRVSLEQEQKQAKAQPKAHHL